MPVNDATIPHLDPADHVGNRHRGDLCPGIAKPFLAADGAIVRFRAPGGRIAPRTLAALAEMAPQHTLHLTSRGNLQLRGLPDPVPATISERAIALGLAPSAAHERVRNIICSPLTGLSGGLADLRPLIARFDELLRADPVLAGLPGRTLFALDDGRGDLLAEPFDLAIVATSPTTAEVRLGGHTAGLRTTLEEAPAAALAVAHAFHELRTTLDPAPWHLRELPEPPQVDGLTPLDPLTPTTPVSPGIIDGHLIVGLPLGWLSLAAAELLADHAEEVIVTPWRSIVIPGAAAAYDTFADAGLIVTADDPRAAITACTGLPGCARSAIATEPLATEIASLLPRTPDLPIHLSGCERRCGEPRRPHHEFLAPASAAEVVAAVQESRP